MEEEEVTFLEGAFLEDEFFFFFRESLIGPLSSAKGPMFAFLAPAEF